MSELFSTPEWLDGNEHIIEPIFCEWFLDCCPMRCIHDHFYTVDGLVADECSIKRNIYCAIEEYVDAGIAKKVEQLFNALKIRAYSEAPPLQTDRIHVANGTYHMNGTFSEAKEFCMNRLTVNFNPEASPPTRWLQFLSELLYEEDIPTMQEYLGYCLLPTTKGQKMLMLIGKGGEGKSRIGLVMNAIFGSSMNTTSIQKVETNRFARADLESKLLMVDDDMDMNALPKTNHIKSIVTSECKMDVERKGVQSQQVQIYARFLCFGNGALTSLHDHTDGFFRRQILLTSKDRPADRTDDPFLAEKLVAEKEGIFLWMLEGLNRLIANNYQFTISERAMDNLNTIANNSRNYLDFMASEGYIEFQEGYKASTKALYETYRVWCADNAEKTFSSGEFSTFLRENQERYHMKYLNNNLYIKKRRCRGYEGVKVLLDQSEFLPGK